MTVHRLVTFLTDYGRDDPFVGLCHAVLLAGAPGVDVVDLTHAIPPQDVRHGAIVLADCVAWVPGAVHVAVVDPGVGTARRPVVVVAGDALLVGPDNGLLHPAAMRLGGPAAAYEIRDRTPAPSRTFDGRDVFMPAAARLASGAEPAELGPPVPVDGLTRLRLPAARVRDGGLEAEVVHVDRFGNLQLGAEVADLDGLGAGPGSALRVDGLPAVRCATFAEIPPGRLGLLPDALGHLQVAANRDSAARLLAVSGGDAVIVTL